LKVQVSVELTGAGRAFCRYFAGQDRVTVTHLLQKSTVVKAVSLAFDVLA
jgi:hypothetical protein